MFWLYYVLIPLGLVFLGLVALIYIVPYLAASKLQKRYSSVSRLMFGPVFGYMSKFNYSKQKYGNILEFLLKEKRESDRFIVSNLFHQPFVVLTDTAMVKDMLLNHHKFYKEGSFMFNDYYFTHSLVSVHNQEWNRQKKILSHAMNFEFFETMAPRIQQIVETNLDTITSGQQLKVYKFLFRVSSQIISTSFFSRDMNQIKVKGVGLTDKLSNQHHILSNISLFNLEQLINFGISSTMSITYVIRRALLGRSSVNWGMFLTSREKQVLTDFQQLRKILTAQIQSRIEQIKSRPEGTPNKDFLDYYLSLYISPENATIHKIGMEEIIQNFDSLLEAGSDTTSVLGGMCFYCLAKYPEWQDRLRELSKQLPDQLTPKNLAVMPELTYFIKEVSRFYPPAFDIFPRYAKQPVKLGDYQFPTGTYFGVGVYNIMNDPKVFVEPKKFDPMRWKDPKITTFDYLTFSAGPRNCIGEQLAMLELRMAIILILRRFKLDLNPKVELEMVFTSIYRSKQENLVIVQPIN